MIREPKNVVGSWHLLMEDFQTSAEEFYAAVEEAIDRREVSKTRTTRVSWGESGVGSALREYLRVERGGFAFDICAAPYGTSYFFSWWTAIIIPLAHTVAVLATIVGVFGVSLLVSGYLATRSCGGVFLPFILIPVVYAILGVIVRESGGRSEAAVLNLPVIGAIYERIFSPNTYYRLDTALMFQESVRRAVNEVIGELRNDQGLRALSKEELAPRLMGLGS